MNAYLLSTDGQCNSSVHTTVRGPGAGGHALYPILFNSILSYTIGREVASYTTLHNTYEINE